MPHPRINQRLVVLIIFAGAPLLWFGYVIASEMIYKGIEPHKGYYAVNLKELGNFAFDPSKPTADQVPVRYRKLDGQRIELSGFMVAPQTADDQVDQFQLVYNVSICCTNGPPRVQERVFARCAPGKTVAYDDKLVTVMGVLHVNAKHDPQTHLAMTVYELDVQSVDRVR